MNPRLWKVGTSAEAEEQRRIAGRVPSLPAELVRRADDRARLKTTLPCTVGERLFVMLSWPTGSWAFAVNVYAVHAERQLIDVCNWQADEGEGCARITVRKAA